MQEIMLFEGTQVEVLEINSIIYFNPYHVAKCLGLTDSAVRKSIAKMTKNQVAMLKNPDVNNFHIRKLNNRGELFLTESGVYKLAFKSNKPNAEAFTNWVADEVLPTIRRTGKYEYIQQNPSPSDHPLIEQSIVSLQESYNNIQESYNNTTSLLMEHGYRLQAHDKSIIDLQYIKSTLKQDQVNPDKFQRVCNEVDKLIIKYYDLEWTHARDKKVSEMFASDDIVISRVGKALMKSTEDYKTWVKKSMVEISCKRHVNTMCVYREFYNILDTNEKTKEESRRWREAIKNDDCITYKTINKLSKRPIRVKIINDIFDAICYCGETDSYQLKDMFTTLLVEKLVEVNC
jgi:prophage antirepressor-like protein